MAGTLSAIELFTDNPNYPLRRNYVRLDGPGPYDDCPQLQRRDLWSGSKVHGATYVVDVTFERHQLDKDDLVVDIGLASELLNNVLSEFNMQNLDELPELRGRNTTTEFMAKLVFDRMAAAIHGGVWGRRGKASSA